MTFRMELEWSWWHLSGIHQPSSGMPRWPHHPAFFVVVWPQVNLEQGGELTCSLSNVILDQLKQ